MVERGSEGPSTDQYNQPVIDPTRNVLDLVAAAIQRQDDLREMESKHARERAELTAGYDEKLRTAESERINAIRAVDVAAVQRASEVANQQAATLALQVSTTADAFRMALDAKVEPIQRRIDDLSRAQYEAQGQKTQVVEATTRSGSIGLWVGTVVAGLVGVVGLIVAAVAILL
jgi:hypothetical protein